MSRIFTAKRSFATAITTTVALLLPLALSSCATPQPTVQSWLDPVTSATITAQNEPLVLAREGLAGTGNERDYVQLAAIEVNRMGDRQLYLVAVLWSSFERTGSDKQTVANAFDRIEVQVPERAIVLTRRQGEVREFGIGQSPLPLPIPGSQQIYFPIERADLRAINLSSHVKLTAQGQPDSPRRYEEFQDGRRSLGDFLGQLPPESAGLPR